MKRVLVRWVRLCSLMLAVASPVAAAQKPSAGESLVFKKPLVGSVSKGHYRFNFEFGIEQWEEGKKSTFRYQKWFVLCEYPAKAAPPNHTRCSLTRTVFDNYANSGNSAMSKLGTFVSTHEHYSDEETLIIRKADWEKGVLDFSIVYTTFSENPTEVAIRLLREDEHLFLDSFKAYTIVRGLLSDSISTIEYRIPEYDFALEMPIYFRGMKSQEAAKREELFRELSPEDVAAWRALEPKMFAAHGIDEEALIRQVVPTYDGKRELTDQEEHAVQVAAKDAILNVLKKRLAASRVSPEGQKRILHYLTFAIE